MMFGEMQAIKARLVGRLNKLQSLIKKLSDGPITILDVVEQSNFHRLLSAP
jgi:hypothetical protein